MSSSRCQRHHYTATTAALGHFESQLLSGCCRVWSFWPTKLVPVQAPAGGRSIGMGGPAVPAGSVSAVDGLTAGMEQVQKDCWAFFNHPDAHAKESGVGMEEVMPTGLCM